MIKTRLSLFKSMLLSVFSIGFAQGCAPYISPPIKATLSAGVALPTPDIAGTRAGTAEATSVEPLLRARVGLNATQYFKPYLQRSFDLNVGYEVEGFPGADDLSLLQGAYLEEDYFITTPGEGELSGMRVGLFGTQSLLWQVGDSGFGLGIGASIEYVEFYAGDFTTAQKNEEDPDTFTPEEGDLSGLAFGELSIGGEFEISYRHISAQDASYLTVMASLVFRLPASIGVIWF